MYYTLSWEGPVAKLVVVGLTACEGLLILSLIIFHIFINCWMGLSTLQVLKAKKRKEQLELQEETPIFN